jgi:hypothetical protein
MTARPAGRPGIDNRTNRSTVMPGLCSRPPATLTQVTSLLPGRVRIYERESGTTSQPGALRLHWHWQPGPLRSFYYRRSTFSVFSVASLVRPGMLALRSVFFEKGVTKGTASGKYYLKLLGGTKPGTSKLSGTQGPCSLQLPPTSTMAGPVQQDCPGERQPSTGGPPARRRGGVRAASSESRLCSTRRRDPSGRPR